MRTIPMKLLATLGLAAMAGACSEGTGPTETSRFDGPKVETGIRTIEEVSSSPVLASFEALGEHVGSSVGRVGASGTSRLVRAVEDVAGLTWRPGLALVPVMRQSVLGTTFVYDPVEQRYVAAPERAGAPANGVRFILYEVGEDGHPNSAVEIGHADLVDTGASSPNSLGVTYEVVSNGITHLSYTFDLQGSIASATLRVDGYLSDGTNQVDFAITTTGQLYGRGGTVTLAAELSVPGQDFVVTANVQATADDTNDDGSVQLSVRSGADRIDVEVTTANGQIDATFTVNGTVLATATGDSSSPVIQGEGGRDLTAEEMEALGAIVHFANGIFETIGGLLQPAGALLALALAV